MGRKRMDIAGQRFGRLVVEMFDQERGRWRAQCDCGTVAFVQAGNLRAGLTKSCGCGRGGRIDIVGQRFGRLVVTAYAGRRKRNAYWHVRCDCGTETEAQRASLVSGRTKSCGCSSRERSRKHGMWQKKAYGVWASMKSRCQNPRHRAYKDYGGRGISVCERWQQFEHFYADMGDPAGVLDRIDVNGNYEPGNCRWTTWSVSNKNQRRYLM